MINKGIYSDDDAVKDEYLEIFEAIETDSVEASLARGDKVKEATKPTLTFSLGEMLKKAVNR